MIKPRQERLKEVYEHLRQHFGVHTQIDFAKAVGLTRPAISSAMNGNEAYLTDNLFKRICAAYQGVFNLDYLLTGEGDLLTIEEEIHKEEHTIDQSSLINAALSAKDETIENLKARIVDLQRTISDKEEIIKARDARIADLERQLAAARMSDIDNYPFSIGAAEDNKRPNI